MKTNPSLNVVAEAFNDYIQERTYCSQARPDTMKGYIDVFTLFLKLMPEITGFDMLTPVMIIEFFKRLEQRSRNIGRGKIRIGVKSSTIKTYWSKLNSFFSWLLAREFIKTSPFQGIKPPHVIYDDQQALEETNIRKLYSAIVLYSSNTFILRRDTAMVSLLAFCGLRLGEFISLEVKDVDLDRRLLAVRGNTSKSKRARYIPIHPTLVLHLMDYIAERNKQKYSTHFLIASTTCDKGLSRHGLKSWIISLRKKSGIKFHLHQFRHSFACNLAKQNVNPIKIQKLLGHSSLDMTMTYLRSLGTEDMHDDITKLSF